MFSKNKKQLTDSDRDYLERVKCMGCCVCGQDGPCDAHHIDQSSPYLVIPLCKDCHQGYFNGIHGQKRIWNVLKKTEMTCLSDTIKRFVNGMA